ncbi:MAG: hypothetical protein US25_C0044G0003 [Candidatus Moranbacteria bacterium GW2011_GWE1_36_7]|nr:MAG: hypothetical protein US16_C0033G0008 [Candidatus Moranbacteria bacterium GW2011_GWE2_36_40]KKQ12797.1 MAG: hypothetical protein US25_C0044G0003 [Candidatus Moranbacteria bacterium GW2011_GWE1_36_7]
MIYLKKFFLEYAEKQELDLLDRTKDYIRDVEREMEKNREEIDPVTVIEKLHKIQELHKKLNDADWRIVEKEVVKMK